MGQHALTHEPRDPFKIVTHRPFVCSDCYYESLAVSTLFPLVCRNASCNRVTLLTLIFHLHGRALRLPYLTQDNRRRM